MKIIKLNPKEKKFIYKRKIIIKDLILNILIGIHNFEKKKKQRVKFNIEVTTENTIKPNYKDLRTIVDYEKIVKKINFLVKNNHHYLLEDLAEKIFEIIFEEKIVKKARVKLEKLDIIKDAMSVGIDIQKYKT